MYNDCLSIHVILYFNICNNGYNSKEILKISVL